MLKQPPSRGRQHVILRHALSAVPVEAGGAAVDKFSSVVKRGRRELAGSLTSKYGYLDYLNTSVCVGAGPCTSGVHSAVVPPTAFPSAGHPSDITEEQLHRLRRKCAGVA